MRTLDTVTAKTREIVEIYWELAKLIVPITILAEIASRIGLIEAIAPAFGPIMAMFGLPPELGLAWLTGILIGVLSAVPAIFVLVPVSEITTADMTVFSALLLFAHALPIEQKIIQKTGPGIIITTLLRLGGGMLYALLLHGILSATGALSGPVDPSWMPMQDTESWAGFFVSLVETMFWMFVILAILALGLDVLKHTGVLDLFMRLLAPVLNLAGIRGEAGHLTAIGLFLGVSYGGGLLIREARRGFVAPRQVFLTCVFMGFAHSVIEDTAVVMALGADVWGVLVARVVFAIAATALIAAVLRAIPDRIFFAYLFNRMNDSEPAAARSPIP